ncbi:MAG: futalosine hydrolase [Bacteroidales bacterium]
MKILLVAATFSEIKLIFEKAELTEKSDNYFSHHLMGSREIDILITGIGMTSSAYHTGKIVACNNYDFAFNFGIAGSFNKNIKIGDVVNVHQDIISELGAEDGNSFLKFDEMKIRQNCFEKTIWQIENTHEIKNSVLQKLPKVKGITVNTVHGNSNSIEKVVQLFNPDVETMEGAAFLHICNAEQIKCAQIRSISNYVEERNYENWNIDLAIEKLNDTAFRIINTL